MTIIDGRRALKIGLRFFRSNKRIKNGGENMKYFLLGLSASVVFLAIVDNEVLAW